MNIESGREPSPETTGGGVAKSAAVVDLRRLLREKFPEAQARCGAVMDAGGDGDRDDPLAEKGKASDPGWETKGESAPRFPSTRIREEQGTWREGQGNQVAISAPSPRPGAIPERRPNNGEDARFDSGRFLRTGVAALDAAGVGLEKGVITEVVGDPKSACGVSLVISGIVREAAREERFVALVDARDSFDPRSLGGGADQADCCRSLLWVRCGEVAKALQATDFLLRDGNLPLVVLDLQRCDDRELGKVPGSTWFRLRSLAEHTGAPLLAVTPRPLIPCSRLRLRLPDNAFTLAAVELPRAELEISLRPEVLRRRGKALYESPQTEVA